MTLIKAKRVLAAKIETTPGTPISLSGSDASFNAWDIDPQATIEMISRPGQAEFAPLTSVPGGRAGTISFKTGLGWDGTATEPSWADTFLPACGLVKSGQVFTPRTEAPGSNVKTLTIACYEDGKLKKLSGCAGNARFVFPTGRLAYIEWTFTGIYQDDADDTILAPTYPTPKDLRFASGLTQWDNVDLCVENVTIDLGNQVILRECASTESGYVSALITGRATTITLNPEAVLVATQDRFADWVDVDDNAFELEIAGPTTSKIVFNAPNAQITNLQEGDRNGMVTDEMTLLCTKNSTIDSAFSITFTAAV